MRSLRFAGQPKAAVPTYGIPSLFRAEGVHRFYAGGAAGWDESCQGG
jgi:hypothetical protein